MKMEKLPVSRPAEVPGRMGRGAAAVAFTALLVLAGAARAEAQFSVQPVIVTLSAANADAGALVTVTNEGDAELRFDFYLGDFDQRADGDHTFYETGEHPRSCASRMTVLPNGATLAPGELQQIQIRMEPGAETCWSLLFVESAVTARSGARVGQRIGVKVYGTQPDLPAEGELTRADAAVDGSGVEIEFRNEGRGPVRPHGSVEIRTLAGEIVRVVAIEPFSVLPGYRRLLAVSFGTPLAAGRYVAVPILDYGGDYLAGGQVSFEVLAGSGAP